MVFRGKNDEQKREGVSELYDRNFRNDRDTTSK